ncbi:MAG: CHASE domain-containing protein, partial [Rhodocyclaceae bacterium]|nr:CHASE domain-containing protein [Rhodocyclaceae bacterium]
MKLMLLALAYALAGWAALFLAAPPGYASPVWPSAGIALALVLCWGPRMLPGVWLGSFAVNLWVSYQVGSALNGFAFAVAAGIALGAALQAAAGVWLLRRHVGWPTPLDDIGHVVRFILLAGPVASVCNATLGNLTLYWAGLLPAREFPLSWGLWWVGDMLGAVVFGILTLLFVGQPRTLWASRRTVVGVPLALAFAGIVQLFVLANRTELDAQKRDFAQHAGIYDAALAARLNFVLDMPRTLAAFLRAEGRADRERFELFAGAISASGSAIRTLEWVPRVTAAERTAFESLAAKNLGPGFHIFERDPDTGQNRPAARRADYFPVLWAVPAAGNEAALGFDLASEPTRRAAIEAALAAGEPVLSAPIRLVQKLDTQLSILAMTPVTFGHARSSVMPSAPAGLALCVIDIDQLVGTAWQELDLAGFHLRLEDMDATPALRLLFESSKAAAPQDLSVEFHHRAGGRDWRLTVQPSVLNLRQYRALGPWALFASALSLVVLLGAFLLLTTGREARTERLVAQRTGELSLANDALQLEIVERRNVEAALVQNQRVLAEIRAVQEAFIAAPLDVQAFDTLLGVAMEVSGSPAALIAECRADLGAGELHLLAARGAIDAAQGGPRPVREWCASLRSDELPPGTWVATPEQAHAFGLRHLASFSLGSRGSVQGVLLLADAAAGYPVGCVTRLESVAAACA